MAGERLSVLGGPSSGREIALSDEDFVVGRDEQGMGNLGSDPLLSRHHARFRRLDSGQVLLEDLGSTNGTSVNGERIRGPHVLSPGDRITMGTTQLVFEAEGERTIVGTAPGLATQATAVSRPQPGAQAPGPPLAAPPEPGYFQAPPPSEPPTATARRAWPPGGRWGPAAGLAGVLVVAAVVVVIALATSGSGGTGVSVPADCGVNIGRDGTVADVVYVESNLAKGGQNSVIAIPYEAGDMKPLAMSQCRTGGSGSTDLTDSGVLDANDQLITNPQHTLLFAVNQGSDTIAVFHIAANGGLTPVPGSPFPSGGKAPSSLGLSGNTLVVANKAQDGVRDLKQVAPNYTTFTVGSDGRLTPVAGSNIPANPGSSPTDASVPAQGGVAFGTEESGPIRGFSIGSSGMLTQAPGSPFNPPSAVFAPGFDPAKEFALGVAPHPSQALVYIAMPTVPALAVYSFDQSGALTFQNSVPVQGAYLPCWLAITQDGHWLYTSNADTDNVTAFDISDPTNPSQIQTLPFQTPGNSWNEALDPSSKFLFVNTPRDTLKVPDGQGNTQHVMSVGSDGTLTELNATSPAKIPVPKSANPQGIAVVPGPNSG